MNRDTTTWKNGGLVSRDPLFDAIHKPRNTKATEKPEPYPLAEGSRWDGESIIDKKHVHFRIIRGDRGALIYAHGAYSEVYVADVLALLHRAGLLPEKADEKTQYWAACFSQQCKITAELREELAAARKELAYRRAVDRWLMDDGSRQVSYDERGFVALDTEPGDYGAALRLCGGGYTYADLCAALGLTVEEER
jgi:hypothetical protein